MIKLINGLLTVWQATSICKYYVYARVTSWPRVFEQMFVPYASEARQGSRPTVWQFLPLYSSPQVPLKSRLFSVSSLFLVRILQTNGLKADNIRNPPPSVFYSSSKIILKKHQPAKAPLKRINMCEPWSPPFHILYLAWGRGVHLIRSVQTCEATERANHRILVFFLKKSILGFTRKLLLSIRESLSALFPPFLPAARDMGLQLVACLSLEGLRTRRACRENRISSRGKQS